MKAIVDQCKTCSTFPPGIITRQIRFCKIFRPEFENFEKANQETDFALIRNALIKATKKD
jgi:asparagine synthase (glutamine-hydrolysing)